MQIDESQLQEINENIIPNPKLLKEKTLLLQAEYEQEKIKE